MTLIKPTRGSTASIYERIGGKDTVDATVKIFYQKIVNDPLLQEKFAHIDMERQKLHQRNFLTYAFGGPNNYDGRSLRSSHKKHNLQNAHFYSFTQHLRDTLEELNIQEDMIDEIMCLVVGTRKDILNQ
jgi:hemoglobin